MGHAQAVRSRSPEDPLDELGRTLADWGRSGHADPLRPGRAGEAERPHQPADAIAANLDPLPAEDAPGLADAVRAELLGVDPADVARQRLVPDDPGRRWPGLRRVVAGRGDRQRTVHGVEVIECWVRLIECCTTSR